MDMSSLASLYRSALSASETDSVRERAGSRHSALPDERTLQLLLLEGRFGFSFTDDLGRSVHILDCGDWNKSAGPDFLNARIQLDGVPYTGDMELDSAPEDWERHNHGSNSAFDGVILHLACTPSRKGWFSRTSRHERSPLAVIPAAMLNGTEALPAAAPDRSCRHAEVLETMPAEQLEILLQSAAAYRFQLKHRRHTQRGGLAAPSQLLYENLAETLGYHANKNAMRHLAQRAPLHALRDCPEALLFGTAGFLVPVLSDSCTPEAIAHHKRLWEQWWPLREHFELAPERMFPWTLSGSRPANHPQRRIGALATIAADFSAFQRLCTPDHLDDLADYLSSLKHPYWSSHVTLPSAPSKSPMALMGRDRIQEFIINHILPGEGSERAWKLYLTRPGPQAGARVLSIHQRLLGKRKDAAAFLKRAWHHQALLQIHEDLCFRHSCCVCSLLEHMKGA
ncbi:MAG: DUF2851 family protein [Akkermansia sp.]